MENTVQKSFCYKPVKLSSTIPEKAHEYIQSILELFDDEGYSSSFEEVANLLICIQQSFLTVLAGPPGSGKTSTALKIAEYQGLTGTKSSHFLNVPVSRGWVSSRDFVGFNNSLKGIFQPAKTGVYQFLKEQRDIDQSDLILSLILLDEANLSPIEHYWSDFLALCDPEGSGRPIDTGLTGEDRYLPVPPNLRFIATINNDGTTEPLSPRLCDRVPIISMATPSINSGKDIASSFLDGAIPYKRLESWFGCQPSEHDEPSLITDFFQKMEKSDKDLGMPIRVSHRKKNAIRKYYQAASIYISHIEAVDFALSQYALPLISGHGKLFAKRLKVLLESAISNDLKRTEYTLNAILDSGETYVDSYSFM